MVGCGYGWGEMLVAVDTSKLGLGEGEEMTELVVVVARLHPPTNITSSEINPVMKIEVYRLCMTQPH